MLWIRIPSDRYHFIGSGSIYTIFQKITIYYPKNENHDPLTRKIRQCGMALVCVQRSVFPRFANMYKTGVGSASKWKVGSTVVDP